MARKNKADKLIEDRANRACSKASVGFLINVMDLGKIYTKAKTEIEQGATDEQLAATLAAFVPTIAVGRSA